MTALLALGAVVFTSVGTGAGGTAFEDLKAGDCLTGNPDDSLLDEVTTVACTQAHDEEVVGMFDIPSASWLTEDEYGVPVRVEKACTARFKAYIGRSADPATMNWYGPDKDQWAGGEHRVICVDETPGMTASVRNSAP